MEAVIVIEPSDIFQHPTVTHSLSLILGVAASFFVWWWLNHKWIPSIGFGPEICKYTVDGGESLHVCAFENSGARDIVDVEVLTRIGIRNFNEAESWIHFSLKTNSSQIPIIEPKRRALVRIFDERESPIFVDEPPLSLRRILDKCKSLEEVFAINTEVEVRLHIFGYDSFSGTRRHYSSPAYRRQDIRSGQLKGLIVVQA